mmetsp:Transcript_20735/g.25108  ORF Transcript_20735/g.25108 Transcript_20735/m.25108 type:complete len:163 (+) Transcript_20735:65-553(+)
MFAVWATRKFPSSYIPTVMDNYTMTVLVNRKPVQLDVWDTAGQENFTDIRRLSYPNTDVCIVCYSCSARRSFENVWDFWLKEIRNLRIPFILCGTKADLYRIYEYNHVHMDDANNYAKHQGAWSHVRCSAKEGRDVQKVFDHAIKCALGFPSPFKTSLCVLL